MGPHALAAAGSLGFDNQVYTQKFSTGGNPPGGYFLTKGGRVKALTVCYDLGNDPELFVIGQDDQVYGQHFDANDNSASDYFFTSPGRVKGLRVTS